MQNVWAFMTSVCHFLANLAAIQMTFTESTYLISFLNSERIITKVCGSWNVSLIFFFIRILVQTTNIQSNKQASNRNLSASFFHWQMNDGNILHEPEHNSSKQIEHYIGKKKMTLCTTMYSKYIKVQDIELKFLTTSVTYDVSFWKVPHCLSLKYSAIFSH